MSSVCSLQSITQTRVKSINLLKYARENREKGFFNDVNIDVDSEFIPANQMILAGNSLYFEKLFTSTEENHLMPTVKIHGPKAKAVKALVDFFYSELIEINNENVVDLLVASNFLHVEEVRQFCVDFMQTKMSPESFFLLLNASSIYDSDDVDWHVSQFISTNLDDIIRTNKFKSLSTVDCFTFLSKLNRKQIPESFVYEALITWIKIDRATREKEFVKLFKQTINVNALAINFIEEVVLRESLVKENVNCHKFVLTAFSKILQRQKAEVVSSQDWENNNLHSSKQSQTSNMKLKPALPDWITREQKQRVSLHSAIPSIHPPLIPPKPRPRHLTGDKAPLVPEKDVIANVQTPSATSPSSRPPKPPPLSSKPKPPLSKQRSDPARRNSDYEIIGIPPQKPARYEEFVVDKAKKTFFMPKNFKVIALFGGNNSVKVCNIFNKQGLVSEDYPKLLEQVNCFCSLIYKNKIFCIGGNVNDSDEIYDVTSKKVWKMDLKEHKLQWETIAPMKQSRSKMGATVHLNGLAVAGGCSNPWTALKSAEFYNIDKEMWKYISPMKELKYHNALVSCGVFLYSLGGTDNEGYSSATVERLCELNGEWESVPLMLRARAQLAAVTYDDKIYAIGGRNEDLSLDFDDFAILKCVERYDPIKKTWSYAKSLHVPRYNHSACVLDGKIYVFGGMGRDGSSIFTTECYDPASDRWTIVNEIDEPLHGHSVVAAKFTD